MDSNLNGSNKRECRRCEGLFIFDESINAQVNCLHGSLNVFETPGTVNCLGNDRNPIATLTKFQGVDGDVMFSVKHNGCLSSYQTIQLFIPPTGLSVLSGV